MLRPHPVASARWPGLDIYTHGWHSGMKRRQIERILWALGWTLLRHGRRHDVWSRGLARLSVPRHDEINEYTAAAILKEARGE